MDEMTLKPCFCRCRRMIPPPSAAVGSGTNPDLGGGPVTVCVLKISSRRFLDVTIRGMYRTTALDAEATTTALTVGHADNDG